MQKFKDHPIFSAHIQKGKQALQSEHRALLQEGQEQKITGSLNFDLVLKNKHLQHKRWDYLIEKNSHDLIAFEVHKFDRSVLIGKKLGTLAILKAEFPNETPAVQSWHVAFLGAVPRQDILARFRAETQINIQRHLQLSKT